MKYKENSLISALKVISELTNELSITEWAVGGSIAVMFFTEPFFTEDLDVFINIYIPPSGIIDLSKIFNWLRKKGYTKFEKQGIIIEDVRVDLIPVYGLTAEAVNNSKKIKIKDFYIKMFSAEYLTAIALSVGRRKDLLKIDKLLESNSIDIDILEVIIEKYKLQTKWKNYKLSK